MTLFVLTWRRLAMATSFEGFTSFETFTAVPDRLFRELLGQIDDAAELRATLYAIWWIGRAEGSFRCMRRADFGEFASGVDQAVLRGTLLKVENETDEFFFLNSPRGRAGAKALRDGSWHPPATTMLIERPNVFRLYEENIGPLTPLIADALKDAEETYHAEWIAEAIELAVKNNKRNWRYCEAVLKRWKEQGRHEGKNREDAVKDFKRYTEDEFAEYFRE